MSERASRQTSFPNEEVESKEFAELGKRRRVGYSKRKGAVGQSCGDHMRKKCCHRVSDDRAKFD